MLKHNIYYIKYYATFNYLLFYGCLCVFEITSKYSSQMSNPFTLILFIIESFNHIFALILIIIIMYLQKNLLMNFTVI